MVFMQPQRNEFHIAFTGHRPEKLKRLRYRYQEDQPFFQIMKNALEHQLEDVISKNPSQMIYGHTGMAQGSDMIWTKSLIDIRQKYPNNLKIVADLAEPNQSEKWNAKNKQEYNQLLAQADYVIDHSKGYVGKDLFDHRDQNMMENADLIISIIDPKQKKSGTYKALKYANQKGKQTICITPNAIITTMTNEQQEKMIKPDYQEEAQKLVTTGPKIQDGYSLSLTGHRAFKAKRDVNGQIMYDQYGNKVIETKLDPNVRKFAQANDLSRPYYKNLQKHLEDIIETNVQSKGLVNCHSGMALGADTVWANAIVAMKEKYPNQVRFIADIPNTTQADAWDNSAYLQDRWLDLLKKADEVNDWSHGKEYENKQMQDRNKAMIDNCDTLIAIYDNSNERGSGTANAYNYAQEIGKGIYRADPRLFDNGVPEVPEQFKEIDLHEEKPSMTLKELLRKNRNEPMSDEEFRNAYLQTIPRSKQAETIEKLKNVENIISYATYQYLDEKEQAKNTKDVVEPTKTINSNEVDDGIDV